MKLGVKLADGMGGCLVAWVRDELDENLLKGVSRSFYLSLRLLPREMQGAASVGYLLARISDTLADSSRAGVGLRLESLEDFGRMLAGDFEMKKWAREVLEAPTDARERELLRRTGGVVEALKRLPHAEELLVREVCKVILSGQRLDLEWFSGASGAEPVALRDDEALDDYTWRVAGSVGEFWTRLGFLTLGEGYAVASEAVLLEQGRLYGKGLQIVNILRDLGPDLAVGRCYLPVLPDQGEDFLKSYDEWFRRAERWLLCGGFYAGALGSKRLRVATGLPSLLGLKTLGKLERPRFPLSEVGVKISRLDVYGCLGREILAAFRLRR